MCMAPPIVNLKQDRQRFSITQSLEVEYGKDNSNDVGDGNFDYFVFGNGSEQDM